MDPIPADEESKTGLTRLLNRALAGDPASRDEVYQRLYAELLRIARSHLSGKEASTLNPSAVVHEAYLRMLAREGTPVRDRRAFFAYASSTMRSVLIDHLRARGAEKRGGDLVQVTLTTGALNRASEGEDFSRLNAGLEALRAFDERACRVVEMRYFAGMTEEEIALEIGVSVPTVKRDWRKARAFLFDQLR